MKKGILTVLLTALLLCVSVLPIAVVSADNVTYDAEVAIDIAEYFNDKQLLSENGVIYKNGQTVFERDAESLLAKSFGIKFQTQFESDAWTGSFIIDFGANQLVCSIFSEKQLRLDLYNRARTVSENGQYVKALIYKDFDVTALHSFKLVRVFDVNGSDNYAIRLYIDQKPVLDVQDSNCLKSGEFKNIKIQNQTGVNVKVLSTLEKNIDFESETAVMDILDFSGSSDLFDAKGLEIKSSNQGVSDNQNLNHPQNSQAFNILDALSFVSKTGGVKWRMKSESKINGAGNLFRFDIGATCMIFSFDGSGKLTVFATTKWSDEFEHCFDLSITKTLEGSYDFSVWQDWKVVRLKAINGRGYLLNLYINNKLVFECYSSGELIDKNQLEEVGVYKNGALRAIRLVNVSGHAFTFRTSYYNKPITDNVKATDIVGYFDEQDLKSQNGLLIDSNEKFTLNAENCEFDFTEFLKESYGVKFNFKLTENSLTAGEKLKVAFGATNLSLVVNDGKVLLRANSILSVGENFVREKTVTLNSEWNNVQIIRARLKNIVGAKLDNGYKFIVILNGETVIESYEINALMCDVNHLELAFYNQSLNAIYLKTTLGETEAKNLLLNAKQNAESAVNGVIEALIQENYTDLNWQEIQSLKQDAVNYFAGCKNLFEVNAVRTEFVERINQVKTIEQIKLDEVKQIAKQSLVEYKNKQNYTDKAWEKITVYLQRAFVAIDSATCESEIEGAVSACKNVIDLVSEKTIKREAVESNEQPENNANQQSLEQTSSLEESNQTNNAQQVVSDNSGCNSSFLGNGFIAVLFTLATCAIALKRYLIKC